MKKTLLTVLAVAVVVGGGAFYGGMKYAQGRISQGFWEGMANINLSGQSPSGQGGLRGGRAGTTGTDGGFTAGEIIAKDDKSITVKLRDGLSGQGGSKIVFFSDATEISKFANGAAADLEIGKSVSLSGKANSHGSITAQSIQLRPMPVSTPTPAR